MQESEPKNNVISNKDMSTLKRELLQKSLDTYGLLNISIDINGNPVVFYLDSGSEINIIDEQTYNEHWETQFRVML